MEHLIKLIDSIVWPVAVIWLGYIFRGEVRSLLGRVSKVKYKDLEANFEKELTSAEEEAKKAIPEQHKLPGEQEPIYPAPYDERYEQLLRIAEESPRVALLEAWVEIETSLAETANSLNAPGTGTIPRRNLMFLIKNEKYAKTVFPLFEDLRNLRNEAAHSAVFVPSKTQTKRYLQLAIELALTFKRPLNSN